MIQRFRATPGQANNLRVRVFTVDRATLLATFTTGISELVAGSGSYSIDIGSHTGFMIVTLIDTGEVTTDGFTADDGELRNEPPLGFDSAEIASQVFSALAGGRSTLLSGPTSAGGPVDQVKTADFDLSIPVATTLGNKLVWFMRLRPDNPSALLIADSQDGLTALLDDASITADQASITRVSGSLVTVHIDAAALARLPSCTISCELREILSAESQKSRHEAVIDLRNSAGRIA